MANGVAKLLVELEPPVMMTCAEGTGIAKGTILALTDPMTVAASSADNDIFGGIAAEEKIASDGKTKIAVYLRGIFACESNGTTTVGKDQVVKALNELADYTSNDNELGYVVGRALETAADGETFVCYVGA